MESILAMHSRNTLRIKSMKALNKGTAYILMRL